MDPEPAWASYLRASSGLDWLPGQFWCDERYMTADAYMISHGTRDRFRSSPETSFLSYTCFHFTRNNDTLIQSYGPWNA